MLKREEIARLKEKYPKGTPIRLYNMAGETSVPPGSKGIVDYVDDIGQIHMKWENGSLGSLIPLPTQEKSRPIYSSALPSLHRR